MCLYYILYDTIHQKPFFWITWFVPIRNGEMKSPPLLVRNFWHKAADSVFVLEAGSDKCYDKREHFSFCQAGPVWPHFCFLLSGKQCKCHDTLKKVHFLACCRLQKLVEAPPQTPIRISDCIWKLRDSANCFILSKMWSSKECCRFFLTILKERKNSVEKIYSM